MSINDPIHIKYNEKKGYWYVVQGRETFYDDDGYLYAFKKGEDALAWAMENLPSELIKAEITQQKLL